MTTVQLAGGDRVSFLGVKECASLGVQSRAIPVIKSNIISLEKDEINELAQAELLDEIEGYDEERLEGELVGSEAYKQ